MDYKETTFVLIMVLAVKGSSLNFQAYPQELKANITDSASMRCEVSSAQPANSSTVDLQHIVSMFITRNEGEEIASITQFAAPLVIKDVGNLELKGSISGTQYGQGFMELVWKNPSSMTMGEYRCKVTGTDGQGHSVEVTSGLEISTVVPSMLDVIQYFKTRDLNQNQLIEKQQADNTAQQTQLNNQAMNITSLRNQIKSQASNMTRLQTENTQLQNQLDNQTVEFTKLQQQFKACSDSTVAFTASLAPVSSHQVSLSAGRVVKFDKVQLNEGGDYHPTTGQFVCRTPGLYLINVHANSYDGKSVCLAVQRNSVAVTSLDAAAKEWHGSASVSATLRLKTGDVLRVVTTCDTHFLEGTHNSMSNSFTGALIHSDLCRT